MNKKNVRQNVRRHRVSTLREEELLQEEWTPWWLHVVRLSLAFLLLYPCISTTLLVLTQFREGSVIGELASNAISLSFLTGAALCLIVHFFKIGRKVLLPIYVFGHEVTHALFVFLCYGDVSAFNASHRGGYIIANRSNIVVSLSPYIFPFWTLVVGLVFLLAGFFIDVRPFLTYFYVLLGASWVFNLIWTVFMIPLGQTDLKDNGTAFSLTIIYLANLLLLSMLLELGTASPNLVDWFFNLLNAHLDVFSLVFSSM